MLDCRAAFVAIAVDQWEPMVMFYSQITAQTPNPHRPRVYAEFGLGGIRIGLFNPKTSHHAEFAHGRTAKISLCLEVADVEQGQLAIALAYEMLPDSSRDYSPWYGEVAIASHGRECYAYDPDGNRLILHESVRQGIISQ